MTTTPLTLPAPGLAPISPSGAAPGGLGTGSDLFAAVLTALTDEQPTPQQDPQPELGDAQQPTTSDTAVDGGTRAVVPPAASTTGAVELTQSRALLNLNAPEPAAAAAAAAAAASSADEPGTAEQPTTPTPVPSGAQPTPAQQAAPLVDDPAASTSPTSAPSVIVQTPTPAAAQHTAPSPVIRSASNEQTTDDAAVAAAAPSGADEDAGEFDSDGPSSASPHPATRHTAEQPPTVAPVQPQPEVTPLPVPQQPASGAAADTDEPTSPAKTVIAVADPAPARDTVASAGPSPTVVPHQTAPTTPVSAPSAPAAVTSPTRTVPADVAAGVRQQLTGPLVKVTQGDGEQILVVQVRPENLGPVTVHAHVRDNTVHVELFAPSDAGRDALTQVSADLRADLQQAHTGNTSLNVSSGTAPSADKDGKPRDGSRAEPRTGDRHPTGDTTGQDAQQHQPRGSNRLLDVLA